jgi:hypothetical protein
LSSEHLSFLPRLIQALLSQLDKSFGLLDESPDRWAKFKQQIAGSSEGSIGRVDRVCCQLTRLAYLLPSFWPLDLNTDAPEGTSYKVLWFARHGQGFHNVREMQPRLAFPPTL